MHLFNFVPTINLGDKKPVDVYRLFGRFYDEHFQSFTANTTIFEMRRSLKMIEKRQQRALTLSLLF